jgi:hypothetical protein
MIFFWNGNKTAIKSWVLSLSFLGRMALSPTQTLRNTYSRGNGYSIVVHNPRPESLNYWKNRQREGLVDEIRHGSTDEILTDILIDSAA